MEEKQIQSILPWDSEALKKLLIEIITHGVETTKVDFKLEIELSSPDQKSELLKDITAIANSYDEGNGDYGFIIYGVKAGKIVGISKTESNTDIFQNAIDQLLKENISPMPVVHTPSFKEDDGRKWGVLVIAPRNEKPYMFFKQISCQNPAKTRNKGEWFVRKGTTTSPGLPEDLARITRKQTDLLILPLQETVRALQDRVGKVEDQYDSALFKIVTRAVSVIESQKGTETENKEKVETTTVVETPVPVRVRFPFAHAKDGPARFRDTGESLGYEDDIFGENENQLYLSSGPAMWLRVMPSQNPQREWPTRELKRIGMEKAHLLPLVHPAGGYSYLRATDGEGMYRASKIADDTGKLNIDSIAFAFKTGEVWSIETMLFAMDTEKLSVTEIEQAFTSGLDNYRHFLRELGISGPFNWKAGMVGIKGRRLAYPPPPGRQWLRNSGPLCAADLIEAEGQIEDGQSTTGVLLPFFGRVFEECGLERPNYLPQ